MSLWAALHCKLLHLCLHKRRVLEVLLQAGMASVHKGSELGPEVMYAISLLIREHVLPSQ